MIAMFYAGLSAVLVLVLAFRVVQVRKRARVGVGDGGDADLQLRIRVHANALENLPLALVLLLGLEWAGHPAWLLHGFGAVLLAARLAHAWGLSHCEGYSPGRFWGTVGTWAVMLGMAMVHIVNFLRDQLPV